MMLPSIDDIRELTYIIQRSNDMILGAVKERDADAAALAAMRSDFDKMQHQATRSEALTRNLLSNKTGGNGVAGGGGGGGDRPTQPSSSVLPSGKVNLATMNVTDLVRLGQVVADEEDVRGEPIAHRPSSKPQRAMAPPAESSNQSLQSLRKLNDQRAKQQAEAAAMLDEARAKSFQARLHSLDRLRTSALESLQKLTSTTSTLGSSSSSSPWGPRATAALYGKDAGGGCSISSDAIDDAIRLGVACWLEWAENRLAHEATIMGGSNHNEDDDEHEDRGDDPNQVRQLYRSLLVSAEFAPEEVNKSATRMTTCAQDLKLIQELAASSRVEDDDNDGEDVDSPRSFSHQSLADQARIFFGKSTQNEDAWPSNRVGVWFQ